ncbi:hypothetical protein C5167_008365 [Papaver somniferum]|uniref:Uncharacterized protein n=2 Tax=Papaver somniferum TaxID=3469 RepID=A0A4Y7JUB6_PAPSO|nr:hypothetical protein C5167_008365 [Papaver somniferum]
MEAIKKKYLMLFNCILLATGLTGGPLLLRLYFIRGGKRIWLSSALGSAVGAVLLGFHSDGAGNQSNKDYYLGFFLTVGAAVTSGLLFPLVELIMQIVSSVVASLFCIVGMFVNNDLKEIPKEGKGYEFGEVKYYVVLVAIAIMWQIYFIGTVGVIFCSTSLLAGVIVAVMVPVTEILAVVFYHESFKYEKGIVVFLSLWGFMSYFYGDYMKAKKQSSELDPGENFPSRNQLAVI